MTSEVTQALLPCPFCGGEAERFTLPEDEFGNGGGDVITCSRCQASSHVEFGRKENLVDRWNARLTAQSGESEDPHRILKNALFALEKLKAPAMIYGGVLTEGGKHAWLEYSLREQGDYSVFSGEGSSGAGEDWISHDGGDCPVDPAAIVEIKLRDGSVTTLAAKAVNWRYGTYIFEAHRTMPVLCDVVAYRIAALNARQSGEGEREALPRLDEGLIIAALHGHYGKSATNIDGIDLTVNGYNWSFREGFKRMWAGVRKELNRRAALRATDDAGGAK
jgi:Lar family restriction alleviation protein